MAEYVQEFAEDSIHWEKNGDNNDVRDFTSRSILTTDSRVAVKEEVKEEEE